MKYEAKKIIRHEKFGTRLYEHYNIALIKLKEKIAMNSKVQPIKLPESETLPGVSAFFTGWMEGVRFISL